ncbi:MAG: glutamate-5-semialdehyde dehydrogenase [Sphaerochaetaceae bacterium]|nr:glutamate-5-semialdehyde dehydrogenase [Sphaerochaetaceae bacterium]
MNTKEITEDIRTAKSAQRSLEATSFETRNEMLLAISDALLESIPYIMEANAQDLEKARKEDLAKPLLKRLRFDEKKIVSVANSLVEVAKLPDPIRKVIQRRTLDDHLLLEKVTVPIGVIGMIFESRPDALVQIISLALKSGNAIILKGGREAKETLSALIEVIRKALSAFPAGSKWIVHLTSRSDVQLILGLDSDIDLLIPRGSNQFVRYIMNNSRIPVLGHADGLCSLYVDEQVDMDLALNVAVDSKCQYPAVCNAVETILVHEKVAERFIPRFKDLTSRYPVIIHGDERTCGIIEAEKATQDDWDTEYLDYEVAMKVVDSMEEAMEHIALHGSGHTDCIVTSNIEKANTFLMKVDSADVFHNCSTRFADGFRFGLGAEVGISTQKIHARGPVGLEGLVTGKWLMRGNGQTVAEFEDGKAYNHKELSVEGKAMTEATTW